MVDFACANIVDSRSCDVDGFMGEKSEWLGHLLCVSQVRRPTKFRNPELIPLVSWSQFFYGIGVGGEYPMTSTTALESKTIGVSSQTDDKLHRGRNVVLAFLMQG